MSLSGDNDDDDDDGGVILEYELEGDGPHEQGWLRACHEALRLAGRRGAVRGGGGGAGGQEGNRGRFHSKCGAKR